MKTDSFSCTVLMFCEYLVYFFVSNQVVVPFMDKNLIDISVVLYVIDLNTR